MKKGTTKKVVAPKVVKEKVEEVKKEEVVVDVQNPGFDPDIPEQKQRWLR